MYELPGCAKEQMMEIQNIFCPCVKRYAHPLREGLADASDDNSITSPTAQR